MAGDRRPIFTCQRMFPRIWGVLFTLLLLLTGGGSVSMSLQADDPLNLDRLLQGAQPLLSGVLGREQQFQVFGKVQLPIDNSKHLIELRMVRFDDESFDLVLTHEEYAVEVRRRADVTALGLPKHGTVFIGHGQVLPGDRLSPLGISERLGSTDSAFSEYTAALNLIAAGNVETIARTLLPGVVKYNATEESWRIDQKTQIRVPAAGSLEILIGDVTVSLAASTSIGQPAAADEWPGMQIVQLDRDELERTLLRGVRRAGEILQPGRNLTQPQQQPRTTAGGELLWIDGQRVVLLKGTPEEIGRAHGELLPEESRRCIESVLYSFGTANVIRTGRWFRHDLEDAYVRLAPFIPERHQVETRALAASLNLEPRLVEVLNVFPELFHCSGFALFGSATRDGKLYHGRVLDYMTTIGLQDAATTFVVTADGQLPFANVGYAGFIGSVSGMNAEAISLGEMGGRGEGHWDGVPMATLMRRALEECRTLEDVKALWAENPRTCEYYYVFADGKTNKAVGVAATPDSIEFIEPGQTHELLGPGIRDAVVLSAGSRLEELRRRVNEKYGQIDAEIGQWLMSRPVAMQSNLHNVLFVPADGVLYVANASHSKPAADLPYARFDLNQLLKRIAEFPSPVVAGP